MATNIIMQQFPMETYTAYDVMQNIAVTQFNKHGDVIRLDIGITSGSTIQFNSGTTTLCKIPAEARPSNNLYFPVLYRLDGNSELIPNYGIIYANGDVGLHLSTAGKVAQLVFGQTYAV